MNDIKEIISVIYLNSYKEKTQYNELKQLLGLNTKQFKVFIKGLYEKQIIEETVKLTLTTSSIEWLEENGLIDIHISDLLKDKKSIKVEKDKMSFDEIYIPINFRP